MQCGMLSDVIALEWASQMMLVSITVFTWEENLINTICMEGTLARAQNVLFTIKPIQGRKQVVKSGLRAADRTQTFLGIPVALQETSPINAWNAAKASVAIPLFTTITESTRGDALHL